MIDGPLDQSQFSLFEHSVTWISIAEVSVGAVSSVLSFLNTTRFGKVQFVHIDQMTTEV